MLVNFKDSDGDCNECYSVCRFYASLLTAVCLLYTAPVGLILSVLNSALFLWNRNFCRGQYVNARLYMLVRRSLQCLLLQCGPDFMLILKRLVNIYIYIYIQIQYFHSVSIS